MSDPFTAIAMGPSPIVALRWAIVDCPAPFTPEERLRWRSKPGSCASPDLFLTRKEAREVAKAHNVHADAWGWRQRVARVRVTIEEVKP